MKHAVVLIATILFGIDTSGYAQTVTRSVPSDSPREVQDTFGVVTNVPPTANAFAWGVHSILNSAANTNGENVAVYGQAFKSGTASSWGGVFETQDFDGSNGAWGLEVDLAGNGPLRAGNLRIGAGIILWRDRYHRGPPYTYSANYGLWLTPGYTDLGPEPITVEYGVKVDFHCTVACLSVRAGERIALSEDGQIYIKYDPTNGVIGFYNGELMLFHIPTGRASVQSKLLFTDKHFASPNPSIMPNTQLKPDPFIMPN